MKQPNTCAVLLPRIYSVVVAFLAKFFECRWFDHKMAKYFNNCKKSVLIAFHVYCVSGMDLVSLPHCENSRVFRGFASCFLLYENRFTTSLLCMHAWICRYSWPHGYWSKSCWSNDYWSTRLRFFVGTNADYGFSWETRNQNLQFFAEFARVSINSLVDQDVLLTFSLFDQKLFDQ